MEIKYVKIPFDIELAKKITNGEVEGKVVTRDGQSVRIVCFDAKQDDPVVALISYDNAERVKSYAKDGIVFEAGTSPIDLMLEVPEYMTFKDGDIVAFGNNNDSVGIFKSLNLKEKTFSSYATLAEKTLVFYEPSWKLINIRIATKEERQRMIKDLKSSKVPKAKECLIRFFSTEEKKDNTMTLNEYQKKALETEDYQDELKIILPTLGLTGEAGEVADKVKKVLRDNNGEFTDERKEEIAKELGDVAWYLAVSANSIGYTLEEICKMNIDKIESRFVRGKIHGEGDNR